MDHCSPVHGAYPRRLGLSPWPLPVTVVNDGIGLCFRLLPRLKPGVSGTAREGSLTSAALYFLSPR